MHERMVICSECGGRFIGRPVVGYGSTLYPRAHKITKRTPEEGAFFHEYHVICPGSFKPGLPDDVSTEATP